MSKDSTPEILKQIIDELYKSGKLELPERRRVNDKSVEHCSVHDRVHIMYQAIYGPDNKPEEGLLHISKENSKFIKKTSEIMSKLVWFVVIAGLSAIGNLMFTVAKYMARQG